MLSSPLLAKLKNDGLQLGPRLITQSYDTSVGGRVLNCVDIHVVRLHTCPSLTRLLCSVICFTAWRASCTYGSEGTLRPAVICACFERLSNSSMPLSTRRYQMTTSFTWPRDSYARLHHALADLYRISALHAVRSDDILCSASANFIPSQLVGVL